MSRMRAIVASAAFVAACCIVGSWSLGRPSGVGPLNDPTDFVAFYCAGRAAASGADPYRAEPLRACERASFMASHVPMVPHLVVPAPLPGYDLAFFAAVSLVPFRLACVVWACALVAAVLATAGLLASVTAVRPAFAFAALAGGDLYASLVPGQIVPFVVCALAGCGVSLVRARPRTAACCALAMLAEPHMGVPVCLALAVWVPATRIALACGIAALAAASFAFLGIAENVEYVARVLPVQAATEGLEFSRQYGLSAALYALGVAPRIALALGTTSYLAMAFAGVAFARRAARALGSEAAIAFVSAAAVLVGGAYAHIAAMAAAIPLALLLCSREGALRRFAVVATFCLAVPWQTVATSPEFARVFPPRGYVDPAPLLARVSDGTRLAQDAWAAWIATTIDRDHRTTLEIVLFKVPTWFGLLALCALTARAGLRSRRMPVG